MEPQAEADVYYDEYGYPLYYDPASDQYYYYDENTGDYYPYQYQEEEYQQQQQQLEDTSAVGGGGGVYYPPQYNEQPNSPLVQDDPFIDNTATAANFLFKSTSSEQEKKHAIVCFGFGGRVFMHLPKLKGKVRVEKMQNLLGDSGVFKVLKKFPGPNCVAKKSDDVMKFCDLVLQNDGSMDSFDSINPAYSKLLWKFLRLLYEFNGAKLLDSGKTELTAAVVKLLSSKDEDSEDDHIDSTKSLHLAKNSGHTPKDIGASLSTLQSYLLEGNQEEAIKFAIEEELWSHALVISSMTSPASFNNVVNRFAFSNLTDCSPLQTLYISRSGNPSALFVQNVEKPNPSRRGSFSDVPLVKSWPSNLSIILSNPLSNIAHQKAVLTQLGDTLWKYYKQTEAAHFCYLVADEPLDANRSSRIILVGGDHINYPKTFANILTIQQTILLEYARRKKERGFAFPSLQPYKLLYAALLSDFGLNDFALEFVENIEEDLKNSEKKFFFNNTSGNSGPIYFSSVFLHQLKLLEAHLKNVGSKVSNKGSTISASKVISSLFSKVSDFFVGAEAEEINLQEPFSASSGVFDPPQLSRGVSNSKVLSPKSGTFAKEPAALEKSTLNGNDKVQEASSESESKEIANTGAEPTANPTGMKSLFGLFQKKPVPQANLEDNSKIYYDEVSKKWVIEGGLPPEKEKEPEAPKPMPKPMTSTITPAQSTESSSTSEPKPVPRPMPNQPISSSKPPASGRLNSRYALPPGMNVAPKS
jgi:hypothetical protein